MRVENGICVLRFVCRNVLKLTPRKLLIGRPEVLGIQLIDMNESISKTLCLIGLEKY